MDPFLLTHRVSDGLYDIGPRISPISIRDQMLRSYTLVTRAIREGLIGPDKPLLVIGAGAAGATAAMVAAHRDVETVLLEQSPFVFSLQANAGRYLDPTIYDWPADHWAEGKFDWKGSAVPLAWEAGYSDTISQVWEAKLEDEVSRNARLTFIKGAVLDKPSKLIKNSPSAQIRVYFKSRDGKLRSPQYFFAMILSCIGAGQEQVEISNFRGKSFWDYDSYRDDNLGLPAYITPRVMISGAGDGALQDFIRVVTTKPSVRSVYEAVPDAIRKEVVSYIATKEDHYQRAYAWSGNYDGKYKMDDCQIQESLHAEYLQIVNKMLVKYDAQLKQNLEPILRLPDSMTVALVFGCNHFSHCYPLNHFLTLLLARYIEERHTPGLTKKRVLYPNTRVVRIEPSGNTHTCNRDKPDVCEHELHDAYSISAPCGTPREASIDHAALMVTSPYNILIVRHGIDWNQPLFGSFPHAHKRHILPYYIGWGH